MSTSRFQFASAIAFDVVRLHPSTCWPFVVFLANVIFIEGHNMQDVVPHALGSSNKLSLHSGVYLLTCTSDSFNITRYFWAHRDYCPWGYHLPVQCLVCGTSQQWQHKLGNDLSYIFECHYCDCGRDPVSGKVVRCRGFVDVKKPDSVQIIVQGKTCYSGWLSLWISQ